MPNQLFFREWIAIALIGGAIVTLGLVAHLSKIQISHTFAQEREEFAKEAYLRVVVRGAVERPGEYSLPRGATVKDLLKQAQVKKEGDRRSVEMKRVLEEGDQIEVLEKKQQRKTRKKRGANKF